MWQQAGLQEIERNPPHAIDGSAFVSNFVHIRIVEFPDDRSVPGDLEGVAFGGLRDENVSIGKILDTTHHDREEGVLRIGFVFPDDLTREWIELDDTRLVPVGAVVEDE